MEQDSGAIDGLVRKRLRALRLARGLSLADLARRAHLSVSTVSRIETGTRRLALDQLVSMAAALDTTLDQLVASEADEVVLSPVKEHDALRWTLRNNPDTTILRRRLTGPPPTEQSALRAHPGQEWLLVLSGTVTLLLGTKRYRITADQAAEFPTMLPHAIGADGRPAEVLLVFDGEARRGHHDNH